VRLINITVGEGVAGRINDEFRDNLQRLYPNATINIRTDGKGDAFSVEYQGTETTRRP
jgi:hypothetical protein